MDRPALFAIPRHTLLEELKPVNLAILIVLTATTQMDFVTSAMLDLLL